MIGVLSQREILEILNSCESKIEVQKITCRQIKAWPVIRFLLTQRLSAKSVKAEAVAIAPPSWTSSIKEWMALQSACGIGKKIGKNRGSRLSRGDILLFGMSSKEIRLRNGRRFHRFFDPIVESESGFFQFTSLRLEETHDQEPGKNSVNSDLPEIFAAANKLSRAPLANGGWLQKDIDSLNQVIGRSVITLEELVREIDRILVEANYLQGILEELQPKAVLQTCFYHDLGFALSLACNRVRIPCAEVQHGQQGDHHLMYTHWNRYPDDGYELMPSHFWMWGQSSANRLREWFKPQGERRVVVGGNPWLGWRAAQEMKAIRPRDWNRPVKIGLVSLQFSTLPDFVWGAIKALPGIKWLFRLHPRFISEKEDFRTQIKQHLEIDVEWELDRPSSADFYELLGEVDVQLTGWSTTAYEALHFLVPTILIHPNGKDAMADYIRRGVFAYADSSTDLETLIRNPKFSFPPEESYMEIGWEKSRGALQELGMRSRSIPRGPEGR